MLHLCLSQILGVSSFGLGESRFCACPNPPAKAFLPCSLLVPVGPYVSFVTLQGAWSLGFPVDNEEVGLGFIACHCMLPQQNAAVGLSHALDNCDWLFMVYFSKVGLGSALFPVRHMVSARVARGGALYHFLLMQRGLPSLLC